MTDQDEWCPARGDIVWLASGSPPLTVAIEPRGDGYVNVEWFDGPQAHRDAFHIHCLRNFVPDATTGANGKTFAENLRSET